MVEIGAQLLWILQISGKLVIISSLVAHTVLSACAVRNTQHFRTLAIRYRPLSRQRSASCSVGINIRWRRRGSALSRDDLLDFLDTRRPERSHATCAALLLRSLPSLSIQAMPTHLASFGVSFRMGKKTAPIAWARGLEEAGTVRRQ